MFSFISGNKDETLSGVRYVSRTLAGEEARACSDLLKQAQTYLVRAQQRDEEDERQRAKQHAVSKFWVCVHYSTLLSI